MSENLHFKDVWLKNDAAAQADAINLWRDSNAFLPSANPNERAKELCVVAYDESKPIAVATAAIRPLSMVREKMAFLRAFVSPDYRSQKVVVPLTYAAHEALSNYARQNPQLRIGGTAAVVTSKPGIYKPVGSAEMVLIGYTRNEEPVIVRWFDHFRL
jgi:hypothetical protein